MVGAGLGLAGGCRGGGSGGGEDTVLANDELRDAVSRTDLQDGLHSLGAVVTTITTNDKGLALEVNGVKDSLNEVLRVMLEMGVMSDSERCNEDCRRTSCWKTFTLSINQHPSRVPTIQQDAQNVCACIRGSPGAIDEG